MPYIHDDYYMDICVNNSTGCSTSEWGMFLVIILILFVVVYAVYVEGKRKGREELSRTQQHFLTKKESDELIEYSLSSKK